MDIFALKSFLLMPPIASSTLAPIEVPDFSICLESIYSFSLINPFPKFIIEIAN